MARPTKHPRTGIYRVRVAIPEALRETTAHLFNVRRELIENLGTRDPAEALARGPEAVVRLKAMLKRAQAALDGVDDGGVSDRDIQAIAGELYRQEVAASGDNPTAQDWDARWDALSDQIRPAEEGRDVDLNPWERQEAAEMLRAQGLPTDRVTVRRMATAIFHARLNAAGLLARRAAGDWSPDPHETRIPTPSLALTKRGALPPGGVTIGAILQGFASDKGWGTLDAVPIPRPLYDRKRTLARLEAFLGHSDPAKVSVQPPRGDPGEMLVHGGPGCG